MQVIGYNFPLVYTRKITDPILHISSVTIINTPIFRKCIRVLFLKIFDFIFLFWTKYIGLERCTLEQKQEISLKLSLYLSAAFQLWNSFFYI